MRDCDRPNASARLDLRDRLAVEQRDAIPQPISRGQLHEQSTLATSAFRFRSDAEKLRRLFFEAIAMMKRQLLQRRPLLSVMTNELPCVLANRTSWRRLRGLAKRRPALHADKDFHPPPNLLPQPPRRTGERPTRSEDRRRRTEIRGERTSKRCRGACIKRPEPNKQALSAASA